MNINDLKYDIEIGHEIEFNLDGHNYFIQPDYEKKSSRWQEFVLYDCADPSSLIAVCRGTVSEILSYKFSHSLTLKDNFERFVIDFIL